MDRESAAAATAAAESSQQQQGAETEDQATATSHHLSIPPGLSEAEFTELIPFVAECHSYTVGPGKCSSLLAQRVNAPRAVVWSTVRRFDKPQVYKHFIKACSVNPDFQMAVGCTRYLTVHTLLDPLFNPVAQFLLLYRICHSSSTYCMASNSWELFGPAYNRGNSWSH